MLLLLLLVFIVRLIIIFVGNDINLEVGKEKENYA